MRTSIKSILNNPIKIRKKTRIRKFYANINLPNPLNNRRREISKSFLSFFTENNVFRIHQLHKKMIQ